MLARRRKNNPIFVGDPGVGKTAIAEGLALKIAKGEVPEPLRRTCTGLRPGHGRAPGRHQVPRRLRGSGSRGCIAELKRTAEAILFIDEIHTIVGAGATSGGTMDASNILKPVLASGEIRCIGSTTYEEYKNHFEKDRALSRRFQKIEIDEPPVAEKRPDPEGPRARATRSTTAIDTPTPR